MEQCWTWQSLWRNKQGHQLRPNNPAVCKDCAPFLQSKSPSLSLPFAHYLSHHTIKYHMTHIIDVTILHLISVLDNLSGPIFCYLVKLHHIVLHYHLSRWLFIHFVSSSYARISPPLSSPLLTSPLFFSHLPFSPHFSSFLISYSLLISISHL